MKLLTRDTSSYRFLTLGGLLSGKKIQSIELDPVPTNFSVAAYREASRGFGPEEENVRRYLITLLKDILGWEDVRRSHDIIATCGSDRILIECKRYDSRLMYLDDHKGGVAKETAVEELHRNLIAQNIRWGILTDGASFRLYYNHPTDPVFQDAFLEVSLRDIIDSTHRWPWEAQVLFDVLSPGSDIRQLNPTEIEGLSDAHVRSVVRLIKCHENSLRTVLKALAVAALEDMGVRPMHHNLMSIKMAKDKKEYLSIFESILTDDDHFHSGREYITDNLCADLKSLFQGMNAVDFAHVDHEFFGVIYQKVIHNGNASHYTNTALSKEMANYISCQSEKSQRNVRSISLQNGDYILDPAIGSGQLLRSLLPFHKVFFGGTSSGVEGWRRLAAHFMGRDIDEEAIWIAKLNIWLATASKGDPFIKIDEFKTLNVIQATINRRGGASIRDALKIATDKNVVACVSNPPWDAFKNDRRRGIQFDPEEVQSIRRSLGLTSKQLNRAQIFLKIIHLLGEESPSMRFSVVLPDSFFVDQNDALRTALKSSLDFYFSYPRNIDPSTKRRIFPSVDNTRKFGIIFGRSQTEFNSIRCYPCGGSDYVDINAILSVVGNYNVFPLFSHPVQARIVQSWRALTLRFPAWHEGEFHQTNWGNVTGRSESSSGRTYVVGGASFCRENSAWSVTPDPSRFWKRMSTISTRDQTLRTQDRVIFSDYINNSKKLNSATFLAASAQLNLCNTVLYSTECIASDWMIYDSAIFSVFVEAYGTSQHMNGFRLQAFGLPPVLASADPLAANIEIIQTLNLSLAEGMQVYDLYQSWLSKAVSRDEWQTLIGQQVQPADQIVEEIKNVRKIKKDAAKKKRKQK